MMNTASFFLPSTSEARASLLAAIAGLPENATRFSGDLPSTDIETIHALLFLRDLGVVGATAVPDGLDTMTLDQIYGLPNGAISQAFAAICFAPRLGGTPSPATGFTPISRISPQGLALLRLLTGGNDASEAEDIIEETGVQIGLYEHNGIAAGWMGEDDDVVTAFLVGDRAIVDLEDGSGALMMPRLDGAVGTIPAHLQRPIEQVITAATHPIAGGLNSGIMAFEIVATLDDSQAFPDAVALRDTWTKALLDETDTAAVLAIIRDPLAVMTARGTPLADRSRTMLALTLANIAMGVQSPIDALETMSEAA
jgi:hypothetical protein